MAQRHGNIEYRRTASWTLCVMAVFALKRLGLRMPKPIILYFARRPIQIRHHEGGRWYTITLDPDKLRKEFA